MKLKQKGTISLADILRRRKMTLSDLIKNSGVQSYSALEHFCSQMGVNPPKHEEYLKICPEVNNSPTDGVIVIEIEPKKNNSEQENLWAIQSKEVQKELNEIILQEVGIDILDKKEDNKKKKKS